MIAQAKYHMTISSVLSVSQLNRQIKQWLEQDVGMVSVEGELSNVSKPTSGHYYFTLKDAHAQIRCAYFKNRHVNSTSALQNGQQVVASGRLSLYEARGDYQLIVEELNDAGLGQLYHQFELLKSKLSAMGLFDAIHKKTLPTFPNCIGIITSPTGAALQDILTTLTNRYPPAHLYVYASEVQGKQAPEQLINAIAFANSHAQCDVLVLARGGGSIEDLWAFNNEQLAHAIHQSAIPIVSGVGHETDFTIADFVADARAATPTAAAQMITPDIKHLLQRIDLIEKRITALAWQKIQAFSIRLNHHIQQLTSPKHIVFTHWQTLDYLEHRLLQAASRMLQSKQQKLVLYRTQLLAHHPNARIEQSNTKIKALENQLISSMMLRLQVFKQALHTRLATLHAVSPLATLERGYAIATHQNHVLVNSDTVNIGDRIKVRLAQGTLACELVGKEK